jgi:phage repressor protein C with HTH and peptisase S24 domain
MTDNNEGIIQRINELIEESGLKKSRFAVEVGINASNFGKKLEGKLGFSNMDFKLISKKTNVRIGWLATGEGQKFKAPEEFIEQAKRDSMPTKLNNHDGIPLIPTSAMAGALSGDSITINEWDIETRIVVPVFKKSDFCIRVDGNSMTPRYLRGDILACTRVPLTDLWFQWGKVYCVDTRQGALIKHVEKGKDDDHILLVSDNPDYKPFEIATSELFGVAIVNGLIRVE